MQEKIQTNAKGLIYIIGKEGMKRKGSEIKLHSIEGKI
jgi:hypothetical protein